MMLMVLVIALVMDWPALSESDLRRTPETSLSLGIAKGRIEISKDPASPSEALTTGKGRYPSELA
jgi:hypothetical protein